jgi:hypothetical protein
MLRRKVDERWRMLIDAPGVKGRCKVDRASSKGFLNCTLTVTDWPACEDRQQPELLCTALWKRYR